MRKNFLLSAGPAFFMLILIVVAGQLGFRFPFIGFVGAAVAILASVMLNKLFDSPPQDSDNE